MFNYVIYEKPSDYPTKFVMRLWTIGMGTVQAGPMICAEDTIEEVRSHLPDGVTQLPVFEDDDPVIVEVWM